MTIGASIREKLGNKMREDAYSGRHIKYNTIIMPVEPFHKLRKELEQTSLIFFPSSIGFIYMGMHVIPANVDNIGFAELEWE